MKPMHAKTVPEQTEKATPILTRQLTRQEAMMEAAARAVEAKTAATPMRPEILSSLSGVTETLRATVERARTWEPLRLHPIT